MGTETRGAPTFRREQFTFFDRRKLQRQPRAIGYPDGCVSSSRSRLAYVTPRGCYLRCAELATPAFFLSVCSIFRWGTELLARIALTPVLFLTVKMEKEPLTNATYSCGMGGASGPFLKPVGATRAKRTTLMSYSRELVFLFLLFETYASPAKQCLLRAAQTKIVKSTFERGAETLAQVARTQHCH